MNHRNIEIKVRLNRKEAEALNKKVKKSRISREAYLRHLINGVVPQDAPPPEYFDFMRELHRVGNNLNQIAQKAHVLNVIDAPRYDAAVRQFEKAILRRRLFCPGRWCRRQWLPRRFGGCMAGLASSLCM